jgi:hypothetical protein
VARLSLRGVSFALPLYEVQAGACDLQWSVLPKMPDTFERPMTKNAGHLNALNAGHLNALIAFLIVDGKNEVTASHFVEFRVSQFNQSGLLINRVHDVLHFSLSMPRRIPLQVLSKAAFRMG